MGGEDSFADVFCFAGACPAFSFDCFGGGLIVEALAAIFGTTLCDAFGRGATVGSSRRTSAAGLSSRRPRKAAWRTRWSAVQVAKRTCATSLGVTQWTSL